jgi:hypothetical protein
MDLDALIAESDPVRGSVLSGPDSAEGERLYRRITEQAGIPGTTHPRFRKVLPGRRQAGRRLTLSAAGAAVAAGLAAVLVVVLPSSPPAAAAVLENAAATAARQPAGPVLQPGQYLYIKTVETVSLITGQVINPAKGSSPASPPAILGDSTLGGPVTSGRACIMTRELWLAPTGAMRVTYSPDGRQNTSPAAGCHPYSWAAPGNSSGANPFFPVIGSGLPTSPAALERVIEQRYADGKRDMTLFAAVTELLEESQTPSVRAALYRVVELLPGIKNLGPMTDQIGRRGTAVGFMDSGIRYELIFNPATSAILEARSVQVVPVPRTCDPAETFRIPVRTVRGPQGKVTQDPAQIIRVPRSCVPAQPAGATGYVVFAASGVVNSDTATMPAAAGS